MWAYHAGKLLSMPYYKANLSVCYSSTQAQSVSPLYNIREKSLIYNERVVAMSGLQPLLLSLLKSLANVMSKFICTSGVNSSLHHHYYIYSDSGCFNQILKAPTHP